jgi:hypothetical protein
MTTEAHPKHGVTQWRPRSGEVIVTAYGDFPADGLRLYIGDAFRIVERDTGKQPTARLTLRDDGAIEIRVTGA